MLRARIVIALVLLTSFAAAAALVDVAALRFRIELDPSSAKLLPAGDPGTADYRRAVRDFGDDEVFVIAMETDDVFRSENLAVLRELCRAISGLPGVRSSESLSNVTTIRNDSRLDRLHVGPLIAEIPEDPHALASLRSRVLSDPLLAGNLVSSDGRSAAINVRLRNAPDLAWIRSGLDERIQSLLAEYTASGRHFHVAGRPHLKAVAHATMISDLMRLMPLGVLVMALVLWIVTGSARGVLIPLGTVLIATLWTFGIIALSGISLNLLTVALGPILIAVGSVYGVHVLAHYENIAAGSESSRAAARSLVRATRAPILMAGASTVIGFGALGMTDTPAARELGAFAAIGVGAVTLISLTALPAFVSLLPLRPRSDSRRAAAIGAVLDAALTGLVRRVSRRPDAAIAGWALLCCVAVVLIPAIAIDTDYLTFFPPESPTRLDFAAVNSQLSGAVPIYVVLTGSGPEAFRSPRNLRAVERIQQRFDGIAGVTHSQSIADLIRVVRRAVHGNDPDAAAIPDSSSEVAELLLLIPKAKQRPLANVDHSRTNLLLRMGEQGSEAVRALVGRLEGVLREELPAGIRASITGDTVLLNRSADRLARSQFQTVGATAIAVFVIVAIAFRSVPLALVALAPNVVPVLLFYGILGAGLAPLSLPTSLIGSIILGIAVDDTVHFLTCYRGLRAAGSEPSAAVVECGRRVGRPIVITSVMLCFGFLVVALSGFATLREFGLLIGITSLVCLATDLILLPALLVRWRID